jgi:diacylglycerol kinase family enzyme
MLRAMRQAVLIVNPFASRVTEARLRAVEQALREAATEVRTLQTEGRGHATELAREAAADADAIFVYAGDGGCNEVVNGADGNVPLGFLPGGRTNVTVRALGLPTDAVAAARTLTRGARRRQISVGSVNGRRFVFSAGVGFDAELVRRVDARGRGRDGRRPGDFAFVAEVVRLVTEERARFAPALEVVGRGRAAFALVANTDPYTYAGRLPIHVAPQARFELGLDLVAPVEVTPRTLPRLVRYAFLGRGQEAAADVLYGHDLDRIEVVCDTPMPLQADGEDLGDVTRAVFQLERGAATVLV